MAEDLQSEAIRESESCAEGDTDIRILSVVYKSNNYTDAGRRKDRCCRIPIEQSA